MSVWMLFTGGGSSVAWPALSFLDGSIGWRATCLVLAAVQLFACAPFHWWLLKTKVEAGPAPLGARTVQEALAPERHRVAMLILVPSMCLSCFISCGLSVPIVGLFPPLGAQRAQA